MNVPLEAAPAAPGRRVHFTPLQLLTQLGPPLIWFYLLFGHWDPVAMGLVMLPTLCCLCVVPVTLARRQFNRTLRPLLTLLLGLMLFVMGRYYEGQSRLYMDATAHALQAQCDRDGYCKPLPGDWRQFGDKADVFTSQSPGPVYFPVRLTLSSDTPFATAPRYTRFRLSRGWEGSMYVIVGGVSQPPQRH